MARSRGYPAARDGVHRRDDDSRSWTTRARPFRPGSMGTPPRAHRFRSARSRRARAGDRAGDAAVRRPHRPRRPAFDDGRRRLPRARLRGGFPDRTLETMAARKTPTAGRTAAKKAPAKRATAKKTATRGRKAAAVEEEYPPAPAGSTSLVIVESPAKAKTIGKYLGRSYRVRATV